MLVDSAHTAEIPQTNVFTSQHTNGVKTLHFLTPHLHAAGEGCYFLTLHAPRLQVTVATA